MAVLNVVVKYYPPTDPTNPITIDDWTLIQINKGSEIQNNKATITLKNYQVSALGDGTSQHSASDSDGNIKFEQEGVIKIWALYDEGSGLDTSSSSTDLLFVGDLIATKAGQSPGKNPVTLTFVDRTFTVLNRVWSENIIDSRAPNIIQSVIRATTDTSTKPANELFDKEGNSPPSVGGGSFEIDARLVSEGGFIQDTRQDLTAFPTASMAQTFKPVYDWVKELSSIEQTNDATERANDDYVQKRAMLFHVDELNRFHWYYPVSGTADAVLVAGATSAQGTDSNVHYIYEHSAERTSGDIVNFIIFDVGTDISGNVLQGFEYDANAGTPIPKDSFRPYQDISLNMKDEDVKAGYLTKESTGDSSYTYTINSYPFTPTWDEEGVSVTSTAEYNTNFENIAIIKGKRRARAEIQQRSNLRLRDPVRIRGSSNIGVGSLLKFTSPAAGERKIDVRVQEVTHVINKSGWTTEISFQEDEPEIQVSVSS